MNPSDTASPVPSSSPTTGAKENDSRLPIIQSLGVTGSLTIFGGSFVILAVSAFLIFLWAGEGPTGGGQAPGLWRLIMLNDWGTRAITLSSLMLRATTSAQAAVCTSLVAALILERRTRSVNNGPLQLIQEIMSSKSWRLVVRPESSLLIFLALANLGIQFSSTILLPDLDIASLAQTSERIRHDVALSSQVDVGALSNVISWMDPNSAIFGEVEVSTSAEPDEHGVSNVMLTHRAFPPFEQADRLKLRTFKGPALSVNTQVSCLRPSMNATLEIHQTDDDYPVYSLSGEISYEQTFKDSAINQSTTCLDSSNTSACFPTYFNCTIPSRQLRTEKTWQPALCVLPPPEINMEDALQLWSLPNTVWMPTSMFFLSLATNANLSYYLQINKSNIFLESQILDGEWVSYRLFDQSFLNTSLCSASLNMTMADVNMSTDIDLQEPEFTWYPNGTSPSTSTLQTMMDADAVHKDAHDRGILSISQFDQPAPLSAFDVDQGLALDAISTSENVFWLGYASGTWDGTGNNWSMIMCTSCQFQGWSTISDGAALFESIINSRGRPAVAVNSFLTLMMQSFYSFLVPYFDGPGDVEVAFSKQVSIPRCWDGIIVVLVMVSIELLCVMAIVMLYVTNIRYSRQGNYWHAVSQLMSDRTQSVLEQSDELRDGEVARILKEDNTKVSVGRSAHSGKVEVLGLTDSKCKTEDRSGSR
ncbi:hypothetical protein F5B20DRAFT_572133 [Whalleya microplaca]|nr:hypothetical protein F5B20DRAFT_572133 [Whalleya microplaca]